MEFTLVIKVGIGGLLCSSSGEASAFQCRRLGFDPWSGTEIPHAMEQQGLHAATTEPNCSGTHVPQLERSPHATTKI